MALICEGALRLIVGAWALCSCWLMAVPTPAAAQQINPTASSVEGAAAASGAGPDPGPRQRIPDQRSGVLDAAGRAASGANSVTSRCAGSAASPFVGMLAVLVIFYLTRGMVRLEGGRSGRTIVRFNAYRALRALDDGDLLHHSGDLRPQHHLRPAAAAAARSASKHSPNGRNGRNTPTTI